MKEEDRMTARPLSLTIAASVAIVFGALTIVAGGRALFGGADMGAVVPFVLWFNFCAGFRAGWRLSSRLRRRRSSPPSCGMSRKAAPMRRARWAR